MEVVVGGAEEEHPDTMGQGVPESGQSFRPVQPVLPILQPSGFEEQPKVSAFCDSCRAFFAPDAQCSSCGSHERVHMLVSRNVTAVLRRALEQGEIVLSDVQEPGTSAIKLLMSTEQCGATRSLLLDVLDNTKPLVRIIAALMHSPMLFGVARHQQSKVKIAPYLIYFASLLSFLNFGENI